MESRIITPEMDRSEGAQRNAQINRAVKKFIDRTPQMEFFVKPAWSQVDTHFVYQGHFIKGTGKYGECRSKIVRATYDSPLWFTQLSEQILLQKLDMWLAVKVRTTSWRDMLSVSPNGNSPRELLNKATAFQKERQEKAPPVSWMETRDPVQVARSVIHHHIAQQDHFLQAEDICPESDRHVSIAMSQTGYLRIYIVDYNIVNDLDLVRDGLMDYHRALHGNMTMKKIEQLPVKMPKAPSQTETA